MWTPTQVADERKSTFKRKMYSIVTYYTGICIVHYTVYWDYSEIIHIYTDHICISGCNLMSNVFGTIREDKLTLIR